MFLKRLLSEQTELKFPNHPLTFTLNNGDFFENFMFLSKLKIFSLMTFNQKAKRKQQIYKKI